MDNKNILYLLVAFILLINVYFPVMEKNAKKIKQLQMIEAKIESEKIFSNQKQKILNKIKEFKEIFTKNQKIFIEEKKSIPEAMNSFQAKVREAIKKSEVKEIHMEWGEAFSRDKGFYTILPLDVVVDCSPATLPKFIKSLSDLNFIIGADYLSFLEREKKIRVVLHLSAFKLGLKK